MKFLGGVLVWGVMTALAFAQPGQCTVTGYGTFDCDVAVDGGGLSFALPDGDILAFTLVEPELGIGYLIASDAKPGQSPDEMAGLAPVADKPGCWARDEFEFCAMVFAGEAM